MDPPISLRGMVIWIPDTMLQADPLKEIGSVSGL